MAQKNIEVQARDGLEHVTQIDNKSPKWLLERI